MKKLQMMTMLPIAIIAWGWLIVAAINMIQNLFE